MPNVIPFSGAAERAAGEHPAQPERAEPLPFSGGAVTPPGTSQNENQASNAYLFWAVPLRPESAYEAGFFLCDRITVVFPILIPPSIRPQTGVRWDVGPDGRVEGYQHRRSMIEGSWTSRVSIEVHDSAKFDGELAREAHAGGWEVVWLRLDGNAVKFFQGWNVYGSADVRRLTEAFVAEAVKAIGLGPESGSWIRLDRGYFNRLDATYNFDLGSSAAAASLVRQLGRFATISHRRSTGFSSSLVFPGRRSSLSVYHKGPEMIAHPPRREIPGLIEHAHRIVRFEVVSRSECLDENGLRFVRDWTTDNSVNQLFDLWWTFVSRLRFPVMGDIDLTELTAPARRIYGIWLSGQSVFSAASQATVYRHRGPIIAAGGPDICLPKPEGDVISFRRVLRPVPAEVPPEFASLMYVPSRAA